jgi:hypothetical protein
MSIDYNKSDPLLQKLDIDNELCCPVCTNTYYNPITLLCQHTFCHHCISDAKIKECPICRVKKFIPKNTSNKVTDNILNQVLELYYGKDSMNTLAEEVDDYLEDKRIRPKIEKDMETKLLSNLNSLATIDSTPSINTQYGVGVGFVALDTSSIVPPAVGPYHKYMKWLKFIILCFISMAVGWIGGNVIIEIISVIRGTSSIYKLCYILLRFCGVLNILYQFMSSVKS